MWKGGPLGSPAGWGGVMFPQDSSQMNRYAGDPKDPPNPSSAALAPTDADGFVLRLMPIGWDNLRPYLHPMLFSLRTRAR